MFLLALQRVATIDHHRSALARAKRIKNNRYIRRVVTLQVLQHQCRTIVLAQQAHQCLQFVITVSSLDRHITVFKLTVLAEDIQELAHILIGHWG